MNKIPETESEEEFIHDQEKGIKRQFSYRRLIIIAVLCFAVSGYLIYSSFNYEEFIKLKWTAHSVFWIICGCIFMVFRHLGYMYRIRLITGKSFTWRQSFNIISLWEFSSAVTPSTVGGAAVAIYFMKKEKLSLGKSASASMLTIFLDQVYLAIVPLLMLLFVGSNTMFAKNVDCREQNELPLMNLFHNMQGIYITGYIIFFLVIIMLGYGLFFNAKALKNFLIRLFSLPGLRKWKQEAIHTGDDIIYTSNELRNQKRNFWIKLTIATVVSWTSFFLIAFCVVMAFFNPGMADIPVIFSRQFPIWMVMLLPITPGGIGMAELTFSAMMCDFIFPASLVATFAVVWRAITYYPYLIAGAIILPRWVNKVYSKR